MKDGTDTPSAADRRDWILTLDEILGACSTLIAALAVANGSGSATAVLVTALAVAILERFPIYLSPEGTLHLTPVITLAGLVLFGWPAAVLGAAAGVVTNAMALGPRETLRRVNEEVPPLVGAALAATLGAGMLRVSPPWLVLAGAAGYAAIRSLIIAVRMHTESAVALLRAVRFLAESTLFHLAAMSVVAAGTVWAVESTASPLDRLLVPIVAAAVTLQLYLPRILRGQQERQVLAGVSVLAAAVDAKDPYTANHSAGVARLCRRVARIMGLSERDAHEVYLTGLLHDVGKVYIPTTILLKPAALSDQEWEVMRAHPSEGRRIVDSIEGLKHIAPLVEASHEHVGGSGYPHGWEGGAIPLAARINLAVDAYNAITTDRPYRKARSPEEALRELEAHTGQQFDGRVVAALRTALGMERPREAGVPERPWVELLKRPSFTLLWVGEMISFLGDHIFFVALTLWVLQLTGSATMVAVTLVAATVGQGIVGLFAGALADRLDRRAVIIASDIARCILIAALPLVLSGSVPLGLAVVFLVSVGTVFFRTAIFALIPLVVPQEDLAPANAIFQTTQRIAEVAGSALGGAIVLALGYQAAFYIDAATFLVSAACVGAIPLAWRAGLAVTPPRHIASEIAEGLRYIWRTPIHRILALLIVPGYLTLAFDALQSPMVIKVAGLSALAYGVLNSISGAGKILSATALVGLGRRLIGVPFTAGAFVLTAVATGLFGVTKAYEVMLVAALLFGIGNIASNIANATLSLGNAPSEIHGRLMASRQVFIAGTTLIGMLVFGRIADVMNPQIALVALGITSAIGTLLVWWLAGREFHRREAGKHPVAGTTGP